MTSTGLAASDRHRELPVRSDVRIAMRDGVELSADIYGPLDAGRPVVFERTPYDKRRCGRAERRHDLEEPPPRLAVARRIVDAGFVYVVQDCRGCGASGGRFDKYLQEAADTADSIAWIRAQPWCDGHVGMLGFSYGAACQLAAVGFEDCRIDTLVLDCGGQSDAYHSGIRQGGAFLLKQATWAVTQAVRDAQARGDDAAVAEMTEEPLEDWLLRGPWVEGHSPIELAPDHRDTLSDFWRAGEVSEFWRRPGLHVDPGSLARSGSAALLISSWHDTSILSTLEVFRILAASDGPAPSLVIGPWAHGQRFTSIAGDADFGPDAIPEHGLNRTLLDLRIDWLSSRARSPDRRRAPSDRPAVAYFEMGGGTGRSTGDGAIDHGGRWRRGETWPPAGCRPVSLTLSGGHLVADQDTVETTERAWISNPNDPVPTLGGAINSGEPVMSGGMMDQNALFRCGPPDANGVHSCVLADVMVFASAPLPEDLVVAGPIEAEIWIVADQPDVDITIKLVDWYPDGGPAMNVGDGILRARYREGWEIPRPLVAGRPTLLRIAATPTANRFRAGHRIRLDVAAANFPNFDVNPQTGGPQGVPGPRRLARIAVLSSRERPSRLILWADGAMP